MRQQRRQYAEVHQKIMGCVGTHDGTPLDVHVWLSVLVYKSDQLTSLSLWPRGIGSRLGQNRLWVLFLAVSDIYPCSLSLRLLESWVPSGLWVHMA